MRSLLAATSAAALLIALPAWGQQASGAGTASSSDQHFIDSALQSSLAEASLSQLASQRGQNQSIKQFAGQVAQSSNSDEQELSGIAQQLRGKPTQVKLNAEGRSQMLRLKQMDNMDGAGFDHQYLQMMVDRYTQDIEEFQDEARHGQDSQVKSFAQKTLPTLRQGLTQAESLDHQVFNAPLSGPDNAVNSKTWPLDVNGPGKRSK